MYASIYRILVRRQNSRGVKQDLWTLRKLVGNTPFFVLLLLMSSDTRLCILLSQGHSQNKIFREVLVFLGGLH